MGTLNEDLSAIKEVEDKIVTNKVARFAYTDKAYMTNEANGVAEYNINNDQNIPTADASVLKVNDTVLSKGYRAQASSVTRMLLNHFFGRMSYNLNKVNDIVSNLIATLIGHRGTANGFATLDENGRVPYSQLPESAMEYKGQWNAEVNTPTLADGTGTKGDFYIVSVSGTQNLGSGDIQFFVNDRIIYDGSVWSRLSAGDVKTVNSVLPTNGNVALTGENIPVSATDPTLLSAPLTTDRYADSSVTNAKIKEPINVAKGGTGATDAKDGFTNLANGLTQANNPLDTEYMIYKSGGDWGLYTLKQFWEYIKGKISSVLGLTDTNYGGTADKATNDGNGNNIVDTYALKSNLQYTKSINIFKANGSSNAQYYLIAETFSSNNAGNLDSLFVIGADYRNRMFEGAITTREGNIVYNYGKDNLPIELYEQTNGDIYVYWLVSDTYNSVALNITATKSIVIYGGDLSPVTPTGSKMTLTEYDYKGAYNHIVHDDASLLEWANCTDGSMKKVLIKSGTYNMTKGVDLTEAGTGYVLAENGAKIYSKVPVAFNINNTSVTTVIHNLSVICCTSINSDYSCAFFSRNIDYLILYNCTATYEDGTTVVNRNLFEYCTCYNCEYYCASSYTTNRISIKVFNQCKCYNCRCKHIIYSDSVSVKFTADSYFYSHCRCVSCIADIEFMQSLQSSTYSFRCYESCGECVGCVAEFYVDSGKSIPQFQYGFRACSYLSGCKETHPSSFNTAIRGIDNCSFISSTTASTGNSNTYVGNSCKIG